MVCSFHLGRCVGCSDTSLGSDTAAWAICALVQVISSDPSLADVALEIISDFESSRSTVVQQQAYEAQQIISSSSLPSDIFMSPDVNVSGWHRGYATGFLHGAV